MKCEAHPAIDIPPNLTCPLCAQERRREAYAEQKEAMARQLTWAVQGLLRPGKGQEEEPS